MTEVKFIVECIPTNHEGGWEFYSEHDTKDEAMRSGQRAMDLGRMESVRVLEETRKRKSIFRFVPR